jgi:hypothetical protein
MTTDTTGLIGSIVRIDDTHPDYDEKQGTVTGVGIPLVRVRADGAVHVRHIDDISIIRPGWD